MPVLQALQESEPLANAKKPGSQAKQLEAPERLVKPDPQSWQAEEPTLLHRPALHTEQTKDPFDGAARPASQGTHVLSRPLEALRPG